MDKSRMKWKISKAPISFRNNFESPIWIEILILIFILSIGLQIYGIYYKSKNKDAIISWKEKYEKTENIIFKVVDRIPFLVTDKNSDGDKFLKPVYGLVCEKDGEYYSIPIETSRYYRKQVGDTIHYSTTRYKLVEESKMFNDTESETLDKIDKDFPINRKVCAALLLSWIGALIMLGFGILFNEGIFKYRAEDEFKSKVSNYFLGWLGVSVTLSLIGFII